MTAPREAYHDRDVCGQLQRMIQICPAGDNLNVAAWRRTAEALQAQRNLMAEALLAAILRVQLANKEGDMILSAWLPAAKEALKPHTDLP